MHCVSDANVWIDLGNGRLLRQTFALGLDLVTTDLIFEELRSVDTGLLRELGLGVVSLSGEQLVEVATTLGTRYVRPSATDLSALVYARENEATVLTGDGALRSACRDEGVPVHGVLWLLDQMVSRTVVAPAEAAQGLGAMLSAGARLPAAEVRKRMNHWR